MQAVPFPYQQLVASVSQLSRRYLLSDDPKKLTRHQVQAVERFCRQGWSVWREHWDYELHRLQREAGSEAVERLEHYLGRVVASLEALTDCPPETAEQEDRLHEQLRSELRRSCDRLAEFQQEGLGRPILDVGLAVVAELFHNLTLAIHVRRLQTQAPDQKAAIAPAVLAAASWWHPQLRDFDTQTREILEQFGLLVVVEAQNELTEEELAERAEDILEVLERRQQPINHHLTYRYEQLVGTDPTSKEEPSPLFDGARGRAGRPDRDQGLVN